MAQQALARISDDLTVDAFVPVACTGAVIDDVSEQLRGATVAGGPPANLVTITIGGNDAGFAEVLMDCVNADRVLDRVVTGRTGCLISEDELMGRVNALPARLVPLYTSMLAGLARGGALVVVGYPNLLADPDDWSAPLCSGVSRSDGALLRRVGAALDARIRAAAERAGATYVSMIDAFEGHELCGSGEQWINGLSVGVANGTFRPQSSFHPNQEGQDAEGRVLANALRDLYEID